MKRIAVVDNEKLKDKEKNLYIQSICPVNRRNVECITVEKDGFLRIDEATCIGCGICVRPSNDAIKIVNLPEILDKTPIHRYGENKFALYSLPTPIFDKVVGKEKKIIPKTAEERKKFEDPDRYVKNKKSEVTGLNTSVIKE